mmetsp:Transcript_29559/g.94836  ORF Transcript_29559/g.94836 Transcript_29559/m.94836 type:complete len:248 (-) Transcript_29559:1818-2561(-)
MKFKSILTRFTLPVRALAFNATGSTLAAAGDSDGIKLINMEDSKIFMTLESEAKYVKSLAYDPNGDFLASTTADGTLQVWNLDSGEVVFQKDKAAPKVLFDAFHGRNGLQWSPEGDLLGIAGRGGEVTLFKRDTWDVAMTLGGEHTLDVSVVSFSPNARYIASAACDEDSGEIILWDVVRSRGKRARFPHSPVSALRIALACVRSRSRPACRRGSCASSARSQRMARCAPSRGALKATPSLPSPRTA